MKELSNSSTAHSNSINSDDKQAEADAIQLTIIQNQLESLEKVKAKRPLDEEEEKEYGTLHKKLKTAAVKETENRTAPNISDTNSLPQEQQKSDQLHISKSLNIPSTFFDLLADLKRSIFSYLNLDELAKISRVDKQCHEALENQSFWKSKLSDFPKSIVVEASKGEINSKTIYKNAHEKLKSTLDEFYLILTDYKFLNKDRTLGEFDPTPANILVECRDSMITRIKALEIDFLDLIYYFLKKYPDVNMQYNGRQTLLHFAVELLHPEAVEHLVCHRKANLELRNAFEHTPLMLAAFLDLDDMDEIEEQNCKFIGECLINNGASVDCWLDENDEGGFRDNFDNKIILSLIQDKINGQKFGL